MAAFNPKKGKQQTDNQTGFGTNAANYGGRFITKNGQPNVVKKGLSFFDQISWFHTMLDIASWKFHCIIFSFFLLINFLFACVYYQIGIEYLNGITATSELEKFTQAYFFSAQTFTTVGYGYISPKGFLTSAVAATQALIGLLSFALATGLLYGRFSKPTAHLKFSENALISPFKNNNALMIRLAPFKNTHLTDAEAKITLGMVVEENGLPVNKFFQLELEYDKVNSLTLSWTLVHPITEDSPLYGFSKEDFYKNRIEILVFIRAFDEMFSNIVVARSSYLFNEVVFGAKFIQMYEHNLEDTNTILHLDKLNLYQNISLNKS